MGYITDMSVFSSNDDNGGGGLVVECYGKKWLARLTDGDGSVPPARVSGRDPLPDVEEVIAAAAAAP